MPHIMTQKAAASQAPPSPPAHKIFRPAYRPASTFHSRQTALTATRSCSQETTSATFSNFSPCARVARARAHVKHLKNSSSPFTHSVYGRHARLPRGEIAARDENRALTRDKLPIER